MTNLNVTKIFFDICKLYCDPFVIGIIAPKIKTLGFKAHCGSTRVNHSVNLFFENEIPLLDGNNWYFSIRKKEYKLFSVKNIVLADVFNNDKGIFAVLLPDGYLPLTVEIKKYDHYQINCNHDPIIDNELKQIKEIIDNMIMLSDFCADNDYRHAITNVWAFDKGLQSTNGSYAMINFFDIPDEYKDWCISKKDLLAIKKINEVDNTNNIHIINYMNNPNLPDQITEKKLQFSTNKQKLILEVDYIPIYSRPLMETLLKEEKKNRHFSFSMKDLKEIKKELISFRKGITTEKKEDLLVRLDITNGSIIFSDKNMYTQKYINLEKNNNVNSCLLCFKVDYLLGMISYCINNRYTTIDFLWEHKKKILDPVLVKCYVPGKAVGIGVLMPVQIRDDRFYDLSLDDYKQYRKDQLSLDDYKTYCFSKNQ